MSIGYIFALFSAIFRALEFVFIKKLTKDIHPYLLAFLVIIVERAISLPFALFQWIPTLDPNFRRAATITSICGVTGTVIMAKALKGADVSLVMPLMSFVPVFSYILGVFILGESGNIRWVSWIIIILLGNYQLYAQKDRHRYDSLKALVYDKHAQLVFLCCILRSIANPFGKLAIQASEPFFYASTSYFMMILLLIPFIRKQQKEQSTASIKSIIKTKRKNILLWWAVRAWARLTMIISFVSIFAAYTIAIKRFGILIGVFISRFFLKEKNIRQKTIASCIIMIGVFMIIFS